MYFGGVSEFKFMYFILNINYIMGGIEKIIIKGCKMKKCRGIVKL